MDLDLILKVLLFGICLFCIVFFFVGLAKINLDTDIESVLKLYRDELKRTKKELDEGNKKINKIEKEILIYKKKLNLPLFNKK